MLRQEVVHARLLPAALAPVHVDRCLPAQVREGLMAVAEELAQLHLLAAASEGIAIQGAGALLCALLHGMRRAGQRVSAGRAVATHEAALGQRGSFRLALAVEWARHWMCAGRAAATREAALGQHLLLDGPAAAIRAGHHLALLRLLERVRMDDARRAEATRATVGAGIAAIHSFAAALRAGNGVACTRSVRSFALDLLEPSGRRRLAMEWITSNSRAS